MVLTCSGAFNGPDNILLKMDMGLYCNGWCKLNYTKKKATISLLTFLSPSLYVTENKVFIG